MEETRLYGGQTVRRRKVFCNTLEDTVRDLSNEKKVYGKNRHPLRRI